MRANYWRRTDTKTLLKHPRLIVVEDGVVLPDGTKTTYMRYEGLLDYVTLIATRGNKLALIKEYSYPHDEWLWQFPEGSIEAGEVSREAADRELAEEAGLAVKTWQELGINYDHHRRTTVKCHVFRGSDAYEVEKAVGDIEEQGTELHWFTLQEVKDMILNGAIVQKNALAALSLYLVYLDGSRAH
jgi:8-oxo-dGTP pyrophosphatase MutT (NUDIX family)